MFCREAPHQKCEDKARLVFLEMNFFDFSAKTPGRPGQGFLGEATRRKGER